MGDSTPRTSAVTANMARALKNSFLWNYKVHMKDIIGDQGPSFPESKAGKETWKAFHEDFAAYLDREFGYDNVSAALDYMVKKKKTGDQEHARSLLLGRPTGPGRASRVATPTPTQQNPKAIAAQRFAAGEIDILEFTTIIQTLDAALGGTTKPEPVVTEAPVEETSAPVAEVVMIPVQSYEEDDLPF